MAAIPVCEHHRRASFQPRFAIGMRPVSWLAMVVSDRSRPALLLAFVVLRFLPDGPEAASWLTSEEKRTVAAAAGKRRYRPHHDFLPALRDPRLWALGIVYLGYSAGAYGVQLWLAADLQAMGFSTLATGFLVALPYIVTMVAMIVGGRSSDASGEPSYGMSRRSGVHAFGGLIVREHDGIEFHRLLALTFVLAGLLALQGPFWSLHRCSFRARRRLADCPHQHDRQRGLSAGGFIDPRSSA